MSEKQVWFYKLKNNVVIKRFSSLGITTTRDGNLIIPIPIITYVVKFLVFSGIVNYKSIKQIINE